MKITNISAGPRGVNAVAGPVLIESGETVELNMTEAEVAVSKGTGWFDFASAEAGEPAPSLEAKHRGRGSYSITDAAGVEVVEGLTKEDAEVFNAMTDDAKAEFVAAQAKPTT